MHKEIQKTLAWILLASLMTTAAFWQAQVAVSEDLQARRATLPPPPKTRHAIRAAPQLVSGDPVATYAARQEAGLTDLQIGWIVEDFKTAGLDLGIRVATQEDYLAQRKTQDRWYREALVEAWCLSAEQSAELAAKLGELYDQAKADFIEALRGGPQAFQHNGQWYSVTGTGPIHQLIDANTRLQDASFLPWNLCTMASAENPPDADVHNDDGIPGVDPSETSRLLVVDRVLPNPPAPANVGPPETGILPSLRSLHPAQLKLRLFIDPPMAAKIEQALAATDR